MLTLFQRLLMLQQVVFLPQMVSFHSYSSVLVKDYRKICQKFKFFSNLMINPPYLVNIVIRVMFDQKQN